MSDPAGGASATPEMEAGYAAFDAGDVAEAARRFHAALHAGEDPVKGWTNLAVALRSGGKPGAAIGCAARALALDPENAEGWGALGAAKLALGRAREAAEALRRAAALDPAEPIFRRTLGLAEQRAGDLAAALAAFEAGAALAPADRRFRFQRATALLQLERYEEAWGPYEARFDLGELTHRGHDAMPLWTGEPLGRRRLLIYAEQGLGDAIQFARFLPAALALAAGGNGGGDGGEVFLETHPTLVRLFADQFPGVTVYPYDDPAPAHDVRVPMTSLAGVVGGVPETGLRPDGGYLGPRRGRRTGGRPRVGLVWRGKTQPWNRSCPFPVFLGLTETPGVDFVSLQRGGEEEIEEAGAGALIERPVGLTDFADDAALAAGLDLVISIDTAACHFAGALGMPVWTLLTSFNDWRFPPAGERTRWYPTMRLIRMKRPNDWEGVIAEARSRLQLLLKVSGPAGLASALHPVEAAR